MNLPIICLGHGTKLPCCTGRLFAMVTLLALLAGCASTSHEGTGINNGCKARRRKILY
jgi:hypothetical protein